LSQALARLRFSNEVVQDDVDEALRLIEASKESLYADQDGYRKDTSPSSRIYNMVRALAEQGQCRPDGADDDEEGFGMELSMKKVKDRVLGKGFTEDQWQDALLEYTDLDIWQTAGNGTRLIFIVSEAAHMARDEEYEMA